jgi:hypothetical protein
MPPCKYWDNYTLNIIFGVFFILFSEDFGMYDVRFRRVIPGDV